MVKATTVLTYRLSISPPPPACVYWLQALLAVTRLRRSKGYTVSQTDLVGFRISKEVGLDRRMKERERRSIMDRRSRGKKRRFSGLRPSSFLYTYIATWADGRNRIRRIAGSRLAIVNEQAGSLLPDLDSELIDSAASWQISINYSDDKVVA